MASVQVAIRVRPLSHREVMGGETAVVSVNQQVVSVTNLKVAEFAEGDSRERTRHFGFDICYDWRSSQDEVYREVGEGVLDALVGGYNACVLAYGQSGSGKTFTMMGRQSQPGLTPRLCHGLFSRLHEASRERACKHPCQETCNIEMCQGDCQAVTFTTAVCFFEIHNERVRDLLAPCTTSLRVREHPRLGPYVQGLSQHAVRDAASLMSLLERGTARRCTASTGEHAHSSRSHAVFTVTCGQAQPGQQHVLASRAHLVDLAGSERAGQGRSRARREEGANINKSLVTLGNVISALAERPANHSPEARHSPSPPATSRRAACPVAFVPYRDSVLTWLLRDSLGAVSPASGCYGETLNTLRYAQRAKNIVNRPVVNTEEPSARTIRELRAEVARLRSVLASLQGNGTLKHRGLSDPWGVPWSDGRCESLAQRWIKRWQATQPDFTPSAVLTQGQRPPVWAQPATQQPAAASCSNLASAVLPGPMGLSGSHEPLAVDGAQCVSRVLSESLPEEAEEAAVVLERPVSSSTSSSCSDTLLPVMRVDGAAPQTELRRTFSSCELVYRRPAKGLNRSQRRYGSQDSLPRHEPPASQPLSPGGSENSLASSSSSVESQRSLDSRLHRSVTGTANAYKPKAARPSGIPVRIPTTPPGSQQSSVKRVSSVPDLARHNPRQKKADIVAAVTQRLYPKVKRPEVVSAASSDSNKDGNSEQSVGEPCARASVRLRDISRKLLFANRGNKPEPVSPNPTPRAEAETQTEEESRTREAAVGTDKVVEPIHAFITSEVFLPSVCVHQCSYHDCGEPEVATNHGVQPDLLASRTRASSHDSPPRSDSPLGRQSPVSPFSRRESPSTQRFSSASPSVSVDLARSCSLEPGDEDECFSDDSLDSRRDHETDSLDDSEQRPCLWKVMHLSSGHNFKGSDAKSDKYNGNIGRDTISGDEGSGSNSECEVTIADCTHENHAGSSDSLVIRGELPADGGWEVNIVVGDDDIKPGSVNFKISNEGVSDDSSLSGSAHSTLFNGLPLSSEESEASRPASSSDNNSCPSPVSSDAEGEGSDSSSEDDFVYYLQGPEETSSVRRLYTIAENSEHSDHSESLEPGSLSPPLPPSQTPPLSVPPPSHVSSASRIIPPPSSPTLLPPALALDVDTLSTSYPADSSNFTSTQRLASQEGPLSTCSPSPPESASPSLTSSNQTSGVFSECPSPLPDSSVLLTTGRAQPVSSNLKSSDLFTSSPSFPVPSLLTSTLLQDSLSSKASHLTTPTFLSRMAHPDSGLARLTSQPEQSTEPEMCMSIPTSLEPSTLQTPSTSQHSQSSLLISNPVSSSSSVKVTSSSPDTVPSQRCESPSNLPPPSLTSLLSAIFPPVSSRTPFIPAQVGNNSSPLSSLFQPPAKTTAPLVVPISPTRSDKEGNRTSSIVSKDTQVSRTAQDSPPSVPDKPPSPPRRHVRERIRGKATEPPSPCRDAPERAQRNSPPSIAWADARQRNFLNVNIVAPSRTTAASDGLGESATASEDSITFVFVGPARRHAPPVLLELVRRSTGRGLQRSVSLDSATRALSRLQGVGQRRRADVTRACSMDTLQPEETYAFLEPARRERGPAHQRLLSQQQQVPPRQPSPARHSPITPSDSEVRDTDDDFEELLPPQLPRNSGQGLVGERDTREVSQNWSEMKGLILGNRPRPLTTPSPPPPPRKRIEGKKAVSWSDVRGCGLVSSRSTHSLPSPTTLFAPRPIIKKSTLAPVLSSPNPSPTPPRTQSPSNWPSNNEIPMRRQTLSENTARRERLHLDLRGPSPPWDIREKSPSKEEHVWTRPEPERARVPSWARERSVSAPTSPYKEHPWYRRDERSPSPSWQQKFTSIDPWERDQPTDRMMSAPSPPGLRARGVARSRSPPRCGSEGRCRSLGDVSELGRDAESLRAFLAQATTLLHSLSDLSRMLEQQPPLQHRHIERAVQTEASSRQECCPAPHPPPTRRHVLHCQRSPPNPACCHEHTYSSPSRQRCSDYSEANYSWSGSSRTPCSWYEPSALERQLEASCASLEACIEQPAEWQSLCSESEDLPVPHPRRAKGERGSGCCLHHPPRRAPAPQRSTPDLRTPPLLSSRQSRSPSSWQLPPSRPPRQGHFSPRAYMRHLLSVRRRIIEAAREEQASPGRDEL